MKIIGENLNWESQLWADSCKCIVTFKNALVSELADSLYSGQFAASKLTHWLKNLSAGSLKLS